MRRSRDSDLGVPPANSVKVRIENVVVRFGGKTVHRGLSLDIPRGETTVIMGPSGCGKSVLLKLIVGLLRPTSGRVWVDGEDVTRFTRRAMNKARQRMGMLFQSSALFDSMTVEENVAFMLRQHTTEPSSAVERLVAESLELVGLPNTQKLKPAELSGGMRKRVGLARAIVMRPELILYDEPTTGLDPITARGINRLIRDLHERLNITSVVVTHDVESALYVASRIAMTEGGVIAIEGSPNDVRSATAPLATQFFRESLLPAE